MKFVQEKNNNEWIDGSQNIIVIRKVHEIIFKIKIIISFLLPKYPNILNLFIAKKYHDFSYFLHMI